MSTTVAATPERELGPLRTSNYTVYVDLPSDGTRVLLTHGYSGAYDIVSASVARFIRSLDYRAPKPLYGEWVYDATPDEPLVTPSDDVIDLLKRRGYLTQLSREDERHRFERFVERKHKLALARMPSYLFMPTYDCNLRCAYCFQDHMRTNEAFRPLLRSMTPAMVDRIVDAMPQLEARHGITDATNLHRNITFFGGEPLLARNRKIVEYILSAVSARGPARFSAISNATELEDYADVLGPDNIQMIQITIDGPAEKHDTRRIYADGSGSFDRICNNVDLALSRGVYIDIRMNIDKTNYEMLPDVARVFQARGWVGNTNFSAYAAPVHATNGKTERSTTFNSLELKEKILELRQSHPELNHISLPDDGLRSRLRSLFKDGSDPLAMMRSSFCGAHSGMYIFDSFGDIYACWERTGDKNIRIGWLDEEGRVELIADRAKIGQTRTVTTNEACVQCRYSMYCGGGCAVLAEGLHGTTRGNYCDVFGRRFRLAVAEAYGEHVVDAPKVNATALELRAL